MKAKTKKHELAIKLRQQSWSLNEIANELNVSKSSVSVWVREVKLTPIQQQKIDEKNPATKLFNVAIRKKSGKKASETWRQKRREYQQRGANRIKNKNPLYIAGCMLYWAEGTKSRITIEFTNSDPSMLEFFIIFLKQFWEITDSNIFLKIHAYTDIHSKKEIEKYWLSKLGLSKNNLKKTQELTANPRVDKNNKKCEWGVCHIRTNNVSGVSIIQEIYGAIKEYANIDDENKWID